MCPEQFWVITMAGQKHDATVEQWQFQHSWYKLLASKHLSAPGLRVSGMSWLNALRRPKDQPITSAKANSKLYESSKLTLTSLFCQLTREGPLLSQTPRIMRASCQHCSVTPILMKSHRRTPRWNSRELTEMIQRWQTEEPIPTLLKHFICSRRIPKMYGLPKIHKANVLLRTIVASRGSLTLNTSRVLADMFGPPGGQIRTPNSEQWWFCGHS